MPARPLHCKHCEGVFLPASDQPWSAVQCPHCSGQMQLAECAVATAPQAVSGQAWHPVSEQEENAARLEATHRKWSGRMVFLVCILPLALLAAWGLTMAWPLLFPGEMKRVQKEKGEAMLEAGAEAERQDIQKAVKQFLTAASWRDMLAVTADSGRVRGVMAWYYLRHPYQPLAGDIEVKSVVWLDSQGRERRRAMVTAPNHAPLWLLAVQEAGVWKVDWEVFANASAERWRAFLREPGGTSVELPLLVALKPAADAYIIRAGGTPDTHRALVLWAMERDALAGAVLEKDSPLWQDLAESGFENAAKVIARVTIVNPDAEPALVRLERIVQKGWLR